MKKNKTSYLVPWIQKDSGEEVPFTGLKKGAKYTCPVYGGPQCSVIWKPNDVFKAVMKVKYIRGNNYEAVITLLDVTTDAEYRIESYEFVRVLNTSAIVLGNIIGLWKFKKSGRYFYLTFEGPISQSEFNKT